jgi:dTDP-4-amino-4,6-dideoxygalactose transaminase
MIPIVRPTLPSFEELKGSIKELLDTGMITHGKYVHAFEEEAARYLNVKHAIAVSSCTTGLMLVLSELPKGSEVILPGFTFSGTYQGVQWNDLRAVIVDCDDSCNIDPAAVEAAITSKTSAIVGVHISGVPCQVERLEAIASKHDIGLYFDAAHAFGSEYHGKKVANFGNAEVFSLGATKVLAVGEGGMITTNSTEYAARLRLAVNHGHGKDDLDCVNKALNARMEEFSGLLGLVGLKSLDACIDRRLKIAGHYKERLSVLPGISFPHIPERIHWTVKDFSMFIDPDLFGMNRDGVAEQLRGEEIQTKKYYYPPLHRLSILKEECKDVHLPRTEKMSSSVLSLPAYSHMSMEQVDTVCKAIEDCHKVGSS